MKLPWDKNYLKISFHVIFTLVVVYALSLLANAVAQILTNPTDFFAGIFGFFKGLFSAFSPLLIAFVIAYLLDPLVGFFQERLTKLRIREKLGSLGRPRQSKAVKYKSLYRKPKASPKRNKPGEKEILPKEESSRFLGTLATFLCFFLILFALVATFFKTMDTNLIMDSTTKTVNRFSEIYTNIQVLLMEWGVFDYISTYLTDFISTLGQYFKIFLLGFAESLTTAGGGLMNFLLGLIISFYLLKDKNTLLRKTKEIFVTFTPSKLNRRVLGWMSDVNEVFSGYIRGQLTDAIIMASLIGLWLTVISVDFALIIGLISGFSNLIPYVGSIVGFVLTVLVALMNGNAQKAVIAAIGILVLQQIDSIFIVPKVVGKSVKLGPVTVLLSLAVFGKLFGFLGLVFAVPASAILKMVFFRLYRKFKNRKL